jgi:hypothetical protein
VAELHPFTKLGWESYEVKIPVGPFGNLPSIGQAREYVAYGGAARSTSLHVDS